MISYQFASVPGSPDRPNEDAFFHVGDLVGVLDGVTEVADLPSGCEHGVLWYVEQLVKHLENEYTSAPAKPLAVILEAAINQVRDEHALCDLTRPNTPAATLCLVRCTDAQIDYLLLGDTSLVVEADDEVSVVSDDRIRALTERLRHGIASIDAADPQAGEYTPAKWAYTNRQDGYWIAAAEPDAARNAITGVLPRREPNCPARLALLTDGASRAVTQLHTHTWSSLLDHIAAAGPLDVIRVIREAEAQNPAPTAERPRKRHDDATIAYLDLTEDL